MVAVVPMPSRLRPVPAEHSLQFGRYRAVRFIGSGSCGEVWEVERDGFSVRYALKYVRDSDAQYLAYLRNEAAILSKISGNGHVHYVDCGRIDDGEYVVFEYID